MATALDARLDFLQGQIDDLEDKIDQLLDLIEVLQEKYDDLCSTGNELQPD